MKLYTPPSHQGQMVERSWGWHEGDLYRRTYDASDRTTIWHRADEESAADLAERWSFDRIDEVQEWIPCGDPDPEE